LIPFFFNWYIIDFSIERNLRPYADRNYWLTPKEILDSSIGIIKNGRRNYTEINIYKNNPNFDITWYTNHDNVLDRWKRQMGLN